MILSDYKTVSSLSSFLLDTEFVSLMIFRNHCGRHNWAHFLSAVLPVPHIWTMHFLENFISIQFQEKTYLETPGDTNQKLSLQIIILYSSLFPYQSSFLHNLIIFQTWYLPVHIPNCFWRLQCKQMKQRTLSYLIIATLLPWVTSEHCKSGSVLTLSVGLLKPVIHQGLEWPL